MWTTHWVPLPLRAFSYSFGPHYPHESPSHCGPLLTATIDFQMGLLDPNTSDGRVIFFLPWEGRTIAGTTDTPTTVSHTPVPTEDDIQFILREIKNYLNPDVEVVLQGGSIG